MLVPTKHEDLSTNILVLGAEIISHIKKRKMDIESLYQSLNKEFNISIDKFYNTLTFLWLADIIELREFYIKIKNK